MAAQLEDTQQPALMMPVATNESDLLLHPAQASIQAVLEEPVSPALIRPGAAQPEGIHAPCTVPVLQPEPPAPNAQHRQDSSLIITAEGPGHGTDVVRKTGCASIPHNQPQEAHAAQDPCSALSTITSMSIDPTQELTAQGPAMPASAQTRAGAVHDKDSSLAAQAQQCPAATHAAAVAAHPSAAVGLLHAISQMVTALSAPKPAAAADAGSSIPPDTQPISPGPRAAGPPTADVHLEAAAVTVNNHPVQTVSTTAAAAASPAASAPQPTELLHAINQMVAALSKPAHTTGSGSTNSSGSTQGTCSATRAKHPATAQLPPPAAAAFNTVVVSAPPCPHPRASLHRVPAGVAQGISTAHAAELTTQAVGAGKGGPSTADTPAGTTPPGPSAIVFSSNPVSSSCSSNNTRTAGTSNNLAQGGTAWHTDSPHSSNISSSGSMVQTVDEPYRTPLRHHPVEHCYKCGAAAGQLHAKGCAVARSQDASSSSSRLGSSRQRTTAAKAAPTMAVRNQPDVGRVVADWVSGGMLLPWVSGDAAASNTVVLSAPPCPDPSASLHRVPASVTAQGISTAHAAGCTTEAAAAGTAHSGPAAPGVGSASTADTPASTSTATAGCPSASVFSSNPVSSSCSSNTRTAGTSINLAQGGTGWHTDIPRSSSSGSMVQTVDKPYRTPFRHPAKHCYKCGAAAGQLHAKGCAAARSQAASSSNSRLGPSRQRTTAADDEAQKAAVAATAAAAAAAAAYLASVQQYPYGAAAGLQLPAQLPLPWQTPGWTSYQVPVALPTQLQQPACRSHTTGQHLQPHQRTGMSQLPPHLSATPAAVAAPMLPAAPMLLQAGIAAPQQQQQPAGTAAGLPVVPALQGHWVPVQGGLSQACGMLQQPQTHLQQQQPTSQMQHKLDELQPQLLKMQQQWQQARLQHELLQQYQHSQQLPAPTVLPQVFSSSRGTPTQQVHIFGQPAAYMRTGHSSSAMNTIAMVAGAFPPSHGAAASHSVWVPSTGALAAGCHMNQAAPGACSNITSSGQVATTTATDLQQQQQGWPTAAANNTSSARLLQTGSAARSTATEQHQPGVVPDVLAEAVAAAAAIMAAQQQQLRHGTTATTGLPGDVAATALPSSSCASKALCSSSSRSHSASSRSNMSLCGLCHQQQGHSLGCPCLFCVTCGKHGHTFEDCVLVHTKGLCLSAVPQGVPPQQQQMVPTTAPTAGANSATASSSAMSSAQASLELAATASVQDSCSSTVSNTAAAAPQLAANAADVTRAAAVKVALGAGLAHNAPTPPNRVVPEVAADPEQALAALHTQARLLPVLSLGAANAILAIADHMGGGECAHRGRAGCSSSHSSSTGCLRLDQGLVPSAAVPQELQAPACQATTVVCSSSNTNASGSAGHHSLQEGTAVPPAAGSSSRAMSDGTKAEFNKLLRAAAASFCSITSSSMMARSSSSSTPSARLHADHPACHESRGVPLTAGAPEDATPLRAAAATDHGTPSAATPATQPDHGCDDGSQQAVVAAGGTRADVTACLHPEVHWEEQGLTSKPHNPGCAGRGGSRDSWGSEPEPEPELHAGPQTPTDPASGVLLPQAGRLQASAMTEADVKGSPHGHLHAASSPSSGVLGSPCSRGPGSRTACDAAGGHAVCGNGYPQVAQPAAGASGGIVVGGMMPPADAAQHTAADAATVGVTATTGKAPVAQWVVGGCDNECQLYDVPVMQDTE